MQKKITELNELLKLDISDILLVVGDPGEPGSETKYVKASTILDFLNSPNINPNKYNTTIRLENQNTGSLNGVSFASEVDNSLSFDSLYPSGLIKNMTIIIKGVEQGLATFYSSYLDKPCTIVVDGIIYNTTFIEGIKNL